MCEVFNFREFQLAKEQAEKLNPSLVPHAIAMCKDEQRHGRSGKQVAQALAVERLSRQRYDGPLPPTAA